MEQISKTSHGLGKIASRLYVQRSVTKIYQISKITKKHTKQNRITHQQNKKFLKIKGLYRQRHTSPGFQNKE